MRWGRLSIAAAAALAIGQGLAFRPAFGQDAVAEVVEAIQAVAGALTPAKATNDTPTGGLAEAFAEPLQLGAVEGKVAIDDPALKRLKPLLFRELTFVRTVCDLPVELRAKVKVAAIESLADLKKALKDQNWQDGVVWINATDDQRSDPTDPIRQKIFEVLKRELPAEKFSVVEKEWQHRQEYERAATVAAAIFVIDERIRLEQKQQDAIGKAISENWENRFGTWRMLAQYNWEYLPNVPDKLIKPHLSEEQVEAWNAAPKHMVGIGLGEEMIPADELWWDGVEEAASDLLKDLFVDREAGAKTN